MMTQDELRLLPWSGPGGKPCYLSTDDRDGYVSRLADHIEALQLGAADQLREEALEILEDRGIDDEEDMALLAARLAGALEDVLRVANSRGHRLAKLESS
ncbi:hypothetical protein J7I94_35380 [Streptomyces sp. ISL-12]|uniref:hypothetical protein n=1 Tax=Streptomyces sp. ISL-12 TaxID=2819177 RepID=UPI001BE9B76A|nr:hypothetical protein [Streptomyces sp. ISL-12]MBT2415752.1 hypothetical protein [Streptomyces sp. ISL-12]